MAIEIIDTDNTPGDLNDLEKSLAEDVAARATAPANQQEPAKGTPETAPEEDQIPEKYKGKQLKDVIDMYENLHSAYGRMANDLGTQRKLTDQLLDLKRADDLARNRPEPRKVSAEDILERPSETIEALVEQRLKATAEENEQRIRQVELELRQKQFVEKHPDYEKIAADPGFSQWIQANPYRARTALAAAQGDWDAGDYLLTEYKERTHKKPDAPAESAPAPSAYDAGIEAARKAQLESGSGNSASANRSGKRVYRRADLIALKLRKPHVYEDPDFQEEILRAYAEGRVK